MSKIVPLCVLLFLVCTEQFVLSKSAHFLRLFLNEINLFCFSESCWSCFWPFVVSIYEAFDLRLGTSCFNYSQKENKEQAISLFKWQGLNCAYKKDMVNSYVLVFVNETSLREKNFVGLYLNWEQ